MNVDVEHKYDNVVTLRLAEGWFWHGVAFPHIGLIFFLLPKDFIRCKDPKFTTQTQWVSYGPNRLIPHWIDQYN